MTAATETVPGSRGVPPHVPAPGPVNDGLVGPWAVTGWRVRSIRTVLYLTGTLIVLYGVYRIDVDPNARTKPVLKWLIGGDLIHDAIFSPVVFAVGFGIKTVPSALVRRWLAGTLAVMVMVLIASYPVLRHQGASSTNQTYLQSNYTHGLIQTEIAIVVLALLTLGVLQLRRRRAAAAAPAPGDTPGTRSLRATDGSSSPQRDPGPSAP